LQSILKPANGTRALKQRPDLVNIPFLDDPLWFAPLHQGAYNKAPLKVIQKLLSLGAWRTLKTIKGEKPVDLCPKGTQEDLVKLLTPIYKRKADQNVLSQIEKHFHEVIIQRIKCLQRWSSLRLPDLEVLFEINKPKMWFPVPGMYGGFLFNLKVDKGSLRLISEMWCRVVEGSGQRHEITAEGSRLIEEGFV